MAHGVLFGIGASALIFLVVLGASTALVFACGVHQSLEFLRSKAGIGQRSRTQWPGQAQLRYMREVHTRQHHSAYRNFAWELAEDYDPHLLQSRYFREWLEQSRLFRPVDAAREWVPPSSWDERDGDSPLTYNPVRIVGQERRRYEADGFYAPMPTEQRFGTGEGLSNNNPHDHHQAGEALGAKDASHEPPMDSFRAPSPVHSTFMGQTPTASTSPPQGISTAESGSRVTPNSTDATTVTPSASTGTFEVKRVYIPRDVRIAYGMGPQPVEDLPQESSTAARNQPTRPRNSMNRREGPRYRGRPYHGGDIQALRDRQRAIERTLFGSTL